MAGVAVEELERVYKNSCKHLGVQTHEYILAVFAQMISKETTLNHEALELKLAGNNKVMCQRRLQDDDCRALCHSLLKCKTVCKLDLKYNNIGDEGAKSIGELLVANTHILHLDLMMCDIGEVGAEHIAKALHENERLTSLRLNGNKFGNKGAMFFAGALQINSGLEHLDVNECDLKTEAMIAFTTVLRANKFIKSINLGRPLLFSVQEETQVHIAQMLRINRTLTELHLTKVHVADFGAERLAEALMENATLIYLNLSCNKITRDGVKQLGKMLQRNTNLEILDLSYNRMEDEGAGYMSEALEGNFSLQTLNIQHNNLHGPGVKLIIEALHINSSLDRLFVWGNHTDEEEVAIPLHEVVARGRLKLENVDYQPYIVDGRHFLAQVDNGLQLHYYTQPPEYEIKVTNPAIIAARLLAEKQKKEREEQAMNNLTGETKDSHPPAIVIAQ